MSGPTGILIYHLSQVFFLSGPMEGSYIAYMIFRSSASSIQDICLHRQEIVNIITAQFTEKERSHYSKCYDQANPTRPVLLRALSFYNSS